MLILKNLKTTKHGKRGGNEYDRKLTEFEVVTMRNQYPV